MNKSILLVVLPCILAIVVVNAQYYQQGYASGGYPSYYNNQYNAYRQQTGLYRAGNAATSELRNARLLNYLFGFLLLLDITNATGNTLTALG